MIDSITINSFSSTPKYLQIVNSIVSGIQYNAYKPGEKLPSLYDLCAQLDVSKRTVERAYDYLKKQSIIGGVHGKGYYINQAAVESSRKVLLLFNKSNSHNKIMYDAFVDQLGLAPNENPAAIDFFIYNNNYHIFENLLMNHLGGYGHYIVVPHFNNHTEKAASLLNQLPKNKLILLDKSIEGIAGAYGSVTQNFKKDLIQSLTEMLPQLRKYASLNMLFTAETYQPKEILNSFFAFCYEHNFKANIVYETDQLQIQSENAYICLMEEDLITVIKKTKGTPYQVGQQVGILAYNDTPLKEILLDGITVMSTDFERMGRAAADLICNNQYQHLENPFKVIIRNSL
jgi:DNA-binding transcriptional regulator YhcF (GntR family)